MNELTLEEQKLLTEFLGERFEPNSGWWCNVCQTAVDGRDVTFTEVHDSRSGGCGNSVVSTPPRLDFSDWRVIGRLIERLKQQAEVTIFIPHKDMLPVLTAVKEALWYKDSQLAICRAILSYLKEGEK